MAHTYDFDSVIDRKGTASIKWDEADRIFGGKDLMPLWVADMDFQVPIEITEALKKRISHGIYGYTASSNSYLSSVQKWMSDRHHWPVEKEGICHSPGIVTALNLIVDGFTEEGDKVLIQPPVYPPFSKAVLNQNRQLVTNPLIYSNGRYTMDFSDLENKLSDPKVTLMILCSPHNPVGRVWTKQELATVAELALKYDVLVISDEIHSDLVFQGHQHVPFATLSEAAAAHSIVCTAPSKTFNLAGLQISNIIIPDPALRKRYKKQVSRFSLSEPNSLGAVAAEAAYSYGSEWLEQCLEYIRQNADFVSNYLQKHIPDLNMVPLEGTYLGWIDCRHLGWDKIKLQRFFLHDAKIALNQGYTFGVEGEGFVRINLACPRWLLKDALNRLQTALEQE
ncbi:MalY/PatB family protein [Sporolactobacillus laevolacticus]|uniref:cysteine-S-conjugate beta-lyase n=1 Tax=Sporolactobacillus laevolacticus DSM 442 TaxID=1395513 RepID=V6IWH9_9BACL|nr:MalY/PatB family protein [Sporolactobacillus laevolacticus]EST11617.1 cystathionine beta-lyase [Sporolactobacillus laevolacticus DSM 442]